MVQIIDENVRPSFSHRIGLGLSQASQDLQNQFYENLMQETKAQNIASSLGQMLGISPNQLKNLPQEFQQKILESNLLREEKGIERQQKIDKAAEELKSNKNIISNIEQMYGLEKGSLKGFENNPSLAAQVAEHTKEKPLSKEEKETNKNITNLNLALNRLNKMIDIRKKGNLGFISKGMQFLSPEVRKDRGEYSRLGKSLIAFSTTIPIRNRSEFEEFADELSDPNLTDARAEGILNAMKQIIQDSLESEMSGLETKFNKNANLNPKDKESLASIWK